MTKIFTAIFLSLLGFTAYAQEINEPPPISKPSCLSICGKQFLRNLDDNREIFFNKGKTTVTEEAKATIEEILTLLSKNDIRQKVAIVVTSYADKGGTKIKTSEALQRAEAIKRYFVMYGFPHQNVTTEVKPYVKCSDEVPECAKYSRKVNINTKGLPQDIPSN